MAPSRPIVVLIFEAGKLQDGRRHGEPGFVDLEEQGRAGGAEY